VSVIEEGRKGSMCDKVTKGAPCKGKGIGRRKKVEEDRERRSSMRGQATKSTARDRRSVEKESSDRDQKVWS